MLYILFDKSNNFVAEGKRKRKRKRKGKRKRKKNYSK